MSKHVRKCPRTLADIGGHWRTLPDNFGHWRTLSNITGHCRTLADILANFEDSCRGNHQLDIDAIADADRPIWRVHGSVFGTAIVALAVVLQWTKLCLISKLNEIRLSLVPCKTTISNTIAVPKTEPYTRHVGLSISAIASISNCWLSLQRPPKLLILHSNVRKYHRTLPDIVEHCRTFSDIFRHLLTWSDMFGHWHFEDTIWTYIFCTLQRTNEIILHRRLNKNLFSNY